MKAFWYVIWILLIIIGRIIGTKADPNSRYIIGFIFGSLAMGALRLAGEAD